MKPTHWPVVVFSSIATIGLLEVLASANASAQDTHTQSARPQLADFAYSIELTPQEKSPVHTALIPAPVHLGTSHTDLRDLRVFNAAGVAVPHAVRTLNHDQITEQAPIELTFFPIRDTQQEDSTPEDLTLRVERDDTGTVINIRTDTPKPSGVVGGADKREAAAIVEYILDTRDVNEPIVALLIEFALNDSDFVLPLQIAQSDDLAHFSPVHSAQPLVKLTYGTQRIEQTRVELEATQSSFLRLRWSTKTLPAPIVSVRAERKARRQQSTMEVERVIGIERANEPGAYDFDLGGQRPVDRVQVVLPDDNTLIQARLGSRPDLEAEPESTYNGRLYRVVREGHTFESSAHTLARRTDRHWVLKVEAQGGGLAGGIPELEIAHHPDQLLFIARGTGPYQLAYGHHAASASNFSTSDILAVLPDDERQRLPTSDCTLAPQRKQAGAIALITPPPPPPYRKYVLWAILIAGVAVLFTAIYRMTRNAK